ncbi:hypothetical protein [Kribbella sp. ALI-6-A]|nr:hypothetical protein [Kribbella sp. ALI-6-A]
MSTLRRHGFVLDDLAEPKPSLDPESPRAAMAAYPVFLVARFLR